MKNIFSLLCFLVLVHCIAGDNFIFETNELPDKNILPSLANGHIGFVVRTPDLTMNGLYNGYIGHSHRARIQNYGNIHLKVCADNATTLVNCNFRLHIRDGVFETVFSAPDGSYTIQHLVYPHRYYNRAIVNSVVITRLSGPAVNINVDIEQNLGDDSLDLVMEPTGEVTINGNVVSHVCGHTKDIEDFTYQKTPSMVCSMQYPAQIPTQVTLNGDSANAEFTLVTVFDNTLAACQTELEAVLQVQSPALLSSHTTEWHKHWDRFGITVTGDDNLAKTIHASIFYLISSLPSLNSYQTNRDFYGLAPGGLAKGGLLLEEYQGHSFWDTETWMHPPVLLMQPEWSEDLLNYRYMVRQAAADNARLTGYKGWRFPWESAFTGRETTPACCPEVVMYQHHVVADINYALMQHLAATNDMEWFSEKGCVFAEMTAQFWESRVQLNKDDGFYDIRGIMGPDEDTHNVTNNGYTNINAGYNLYFGDFAACVCNNQTPEADSERYGKIAKKLRLLFNEEEKYHPQYEGYVKGTPIKQADVVLMSYPLNYPMSEEVKRNDLKIYGDVTRPDGPAMTWAMHIVAHLDLNEEAEASVLLRRTYTNYVREPFKVWSEVQPGVVGAGNFITGAGGFLQSIINGYAGVRLYFDHMEIIKSVLPPSTTSLKLEGITYLGSIFGIEITNSVTIIDVKNLNSAIEIEVESDKKGIVSIAQGGQIQKDHDEIITIRRKTYLYGECKLPVMLIGQNNGSSNSINKMFVGCIVAMVAYFNKIW